jgi:hypothetical protein
MFSPYDRDNLWAFYFHGPSIVKVHYKGVTLGKKMYYFVKTFGIILGVVFLILFNVLINM